MVNPHLMPYCELPAHKVAVGSGPQIARLTKLAQVIKATYRDPFDMELPLPPHYWELQKVGDAGAFIRGTRSDKDGVSGIIDGKKLRQAAGGEQWYLVLRPDLSRESLETISWTGAVWIDWQKNEWVVLDAPPVFEKRRLIRLPVWTSRWKALSGGFVEGPPGTTFLDDGVVTTAQIRKPFGTTKRPWRILVDHELLRTFVQLHYYDCAAKSTTSVPGGLALRALGSKLDQRTLVREPGPLIVGGGTAMDDSGTIFVLHERTQAQSHDVELAFELTDNELIYVDLAASGSTRLQKKPSPQIPKRPTQRYLLPKGWHSSGWEARIGGSPRASWHSMRPSAPGVTPAVELDTSAAQPIVFHLDDTILYKGDYPATLPAGARVTFFDHRLAFRGPTFDPVVPYWYSQPLSTNYLRAEEVVVTGGDDFAMTLFVINHEGDFYVLREARVEAAGKLADANAVGARRAVLGAPEDRVGASPSSAHPSWADRSVLILLTDAYPGPYDAAREGPFLAANPDAMISHLLVYVPLKLEAGGGKPDATPPIAPVTPAQLTTVRRQLMDAGARWDQLHPAHAPFSRAQKDYVAVPAGGAKKGTRVLKLRHFFAERGDGGHAITIKVTNEDLRSSVDYFTVTMEYAAASGAGTGPGSATDADSDHVAEQFFTLAHELGHVMGLPDEYMEMIEVKDVKPPVLNFGPRVPTIRQRDDAYPFYQDDTAMMWFNELPRLRYHAHRLPFLNGAKDLLPEGPYVLRHPTFRGGLTYLPPLGKHTWEVYDSKLLPNARSKIYLYRVGDDEATTEALFPRPPGAPTAPGKWIDGLVVVRMDIWFTFLGSKDGDYLNDAERWKVLHDFYRKCVINERYEPPRRFILQGPTGAAITNIGVLFEVRCGFAPVTDLTGKVFSDFVVEAVYQIGGGVPPAPPDANQTLLSPKLMINDNAVGTAVLRYGLGQAVDPAAPDNTPLGSGDLDPVARAVESLLGQSTGSFSPRVLL